MQAGEPGAAALYATALLEAGRDDEACAVAIDPPPQSVAANAKPTRAAFLIPAYCAAVKGDQPGANLALQLARDRGVQAPVPFAAIERLGKTASKPIALPSSVETFDYLFLKLDPKSLPASLAAKASPALLFLIAHDEAAPPALRLAAAERAASLNVIDGAALAKAYRDVAPRNHQGRHAAGAPRQTSCRTRSGAIGQDQGRVDRRAVGECARCRNRIAVAEALSRRESRRRTRRQQFCRDGCASRRLPATTKRLGAFSTRRRQAQSLAAFAGGG